METPQRHRSSGLSSRLRAKNPAFANKLQQMALPLAPLVQLTTGHIHPAFPATLLNFWLLTDAQLDELASFYHQRTPSNWTAHYPCPITWAEGLTHEEKRRKIGKFIGLRGCETPVAAVAPHHYQQYPQKMDVDGDDVDPEVLRSLRRNSEQIREEATRRRVNGRREEDVLRGKMGWYQ